MTEFVIKYEYYSWLEGCGCCSDSSSEIEVYKTDGGHLVISMMSPIMENEAELSAYINEHFPEYNSFYIHDDTRWY